MQHLQKKIHKEDIRTFDLQGGLPVIKEDIIYKLPPSLLNTYCNFASCIVQV
jgi:hypothetical protein